MENLKSIRDFTKELGILDPLILNRLFQENNVYISTISGINDGFIHIDVYNSIMYTKSQYESDLLSEDELRDIKNPFIPIGKESYVYFLFDGRSIVYVGQSIRILGRIQDHIPGKVFDSVALIKTDKKKLLIIESFYIFKFQAKYNNAGDKQDLYINTLIRLSL